MKPRCPSTSQVIARKAEKTKRRELSLSAFGVNPRVADKFATRKSSPSLSQLDPYFIERGLLSVNRLRRSAVIVLHPWATISPKGSAPQLPSKEQPQGLRLARHYQALLDTGKFESRAALARFLGVSRARVTQVLRRLDAKSDHQAATG